MKFYLTGDTHGDFSRFTYDFIDIKDPVGVIILGDAGVNYYLNKRDYKLKQQLKDTLPNVILTMFGEFYNEKTKFIEISFKPRQGGTNSINIVRIIKIGLHAIKDFIQIRIAIWGKER